MNPYPGLRPFAEDEAQFFMGRDVLTNIVKTRTHVSPLTVLFARSGMGKSSFLSCRLVPALRNDSRVIYQNEWGSELAENIIDHNLNSLKSLKNEPKNEMDILILDQFEDVFKSPRDLDKLWDKLAQIVNVPTNDTHVLISMREEWIGVWGEAIDYLPEALNSIIRLAPLTERELKRAIRKPVEIEGRISIAEGFERQLIADLSLPNAFGFGETYVEPGLLQLVCRRLWQEANDSGKLIIDTGLYESLGRSDQIIRDFVWYELGNAGSEQSTFTVYDRVLWAGLTRHLSIAQGVKSIVTPVSLAKKIRLDDMGIAGPAVADAQNALKYLEILPEKRQHPPKNLLNWITSVLDKGVKAGFLKRQKGLFRKLATSNNDNSYDIFELSHDALGPFFQQFSLEFEAWVRKKWAIVVGIITSILFVLPFSLWLTYDLFKEITLGGVVLIFFGFLIYFAIIYLFMLLFRLLFNFLYKLFGFPILRRLIKGRILLKRQKK